MNEPLYAEEALSREQMIRFYTSNNAYLIFQEKELGSLEAGKLADFVIVDRDLMTCKAEEIAEHKGAGDVSRREAGVAVDDYLSMTGWLLRK